MALLKKPDVKLQKGIRAVGAIALMSVLAKWYAAMRGGRAAARTAGDY